MISKHELLMAWTNASFKGNQAALLSAALKLSGKLPHELTRGGIMRASHCEGDTMSNYISQVFVAYKVDQFIWAHKRIEKEHIRYDSLITEYRKANAPPWETLRDILSEMRDAAGDEGLFNFNFSDDDTTVTSYHRTRAGRILADRFLGTDPNAARKAVCPECRQKRSTHDGSPAHPDPVEADGTPDSTDEGFVPDPGWVETLHEIKRMEDEGIIDDVE